MKVYVSADIEGVAGIHSFDEAMKSQAGYREFQAQMTAEVRAACEGALAAGATAITVKDAHGGANNLSGRELPRPTELIRGWSGDPYGMVQGLDASYDAVLCVGYHARAGAGGNPLAHTMSSRKVHEIRIDGVPASEYRIHALAAALEGVPVVFVSADETLCREVEQTVPATVTVATKRGEGPSQHSLHPEESVDRIRKDVERALRGDLSACRLDPPGGARLEVTYKQHTNAYVASQFPGATLVDAHTVALDCERYLDLLRALLFLV